MKFILCLILIIIITPKLISSQFIFRHSSCGDTTYAPNSTYQANLRAVLNALSTDNRITYGFYNFTAGREPDRVSSLAMCRGDVPLGTCRACIRDAANLIPQACRNKTEAFGYNLYCTTFISNRVIYGIVQDRPRWYLTTSDNVSDIVGFNQTLSSLMSSLQNRAASGTAELKYATGEANLTDNQTVYGLVQCTPDLSKQRCIQCIQGSLSLLPSCCIQPNYNAAGVTIVEPSCFVRYELYSFFGNVPNRNPPPLPPPLPPSTSPTLPPINDKTSPKAGGRSKKSLNPILIVVPIVVATILVVGVVLCITLKRKKLRSSWMIKFNKEEVEALRSLQFSFGTVKHATGDFSDDNKLGEGGFGTVYKGVLSDGQELAVKRLSTRSSQGDLQFKNEILLLAKLEHRNLVRLLGFCLHEEEMLLIYEFVENRSLDYFIFDPVQRESMRWETRYKIIYGIARGLLYLHEESRTRIIHRDLKAGNVLLDAEFNPKIADFGMARLFNVDQTQPTSNIVGTYGYMSPEYVQRGQVSMKTDVFSFGVLVLEIVSGQRISSFFDGENPENLLSFAWKNWVAVTAWNIVDPTLSSTNFSPDIIRCIHIGLLCVQENPADRPTMSSVDLMLSNYSLSLQVPLQPAFFIESNSQSNHPSQGNTTNHSNSTSTGASINGVTVSELHPR